MPNPRAVALEIRRGDRGYEVVDIQRRLINLDYDLGPTKADGFFGPCTDEAVKAFQRDRKLDANGIVSEKTWQLMVNATYRFGSRGLYLRSPFIRGDDVRQLQLWLNSIGFRTEPIDGIFGPSTEKAVREFQENMGLGRDGIVGPSTMAALNNLRAILNLSSEPVLADIAPAESVVSLLQDRQIAVGCPTPHKNDWLARTSNAQLTCADLAHRLSNLLEILGAAVDFFRLTPDPSVNGEVVIAFAPGAGLVREDRLGLACDPANPAAVELASFIMTELEKAMKENIADILLSEPIVTDRAAVTILLGDFASFAQSGNLKKDVFKQKIAGAVFDGLKDFFTAGS